MIAKLKENISAQELFNFLADIQNRIVDNKPKPSDFRFVDDLCQVIRPVQTEKRVYKRTPSSDFN